VADVDTGRAVTYRTQFRVASVTKMYIAAVVLNLVDRGSCP
jgi:CubicO group peptidase (beta-lactamase class C family)